MFLENKTGSNFNDERTKNEGEIIMIRRIGKCERCEVKSKSLRYFRGKKLCWKCFKEASTSITERLGLHPRAYTIEQALERTYKINGYFDKHGDKIIGYKAFPKILIGHKVKLVLADD